MTDENPQPPPFWIRLLIFTDRLLESLRNRIGRSLTNTAEFLEWVIAPILGFLTYVLLSPFRWFFRSKIVETTQKAQDGLADSTANVLVRFRDLLADWIPRIFPPTLFWPFYWVYDCIVWFLDFFLAWCFTRHPKKLLYSLPAVLLSMPLLAALILGAAYSEAQKIRHYNLARLDALDEKNEQRASFLLSRLNQLGFEEREQAEFERAMALVEDEKVDEAMSVLKVLAPEQTAGFAHAHVYLAAALIDGTISEPNPWELIRIHTDHALSLEPEHPLAKRFLVECQLQDEEIDLAIEGMEALRKKFPDFNAELAHRYAIRKQFIEAKRYARAAIEHFQELRQKASEDGTTSDSNIEITPQGYLRMAEVYGLVGEERDELAMLREGAERYRQSEVNQQAYCRRLEEGLVDFDLSKEQHREILKQLLIIAPNHEIALRLLFVPITSGNDTAEAMARELLAEPQAPAKLLKAIGDMFLTTEKLEDARMAYKQACERDDQSAYAWNNLAWIWSNAEPVDLEMALRCTDLALKAKADPNFYETRGQILVKLERWEEAAQFLERAINASIPNPKDAHRSLATIYTALNKPEQAAAHQAASGQ